MTSRLEPPDNLNASANRHRGWWSALGVSLGAALLIVSPFFWRGNASGHDIAFHASSWLDAAGQWKEGILFPRWAEWANHGFGEPRFIFYPPLSWMLGAALGLVVPWNAVPGTFIVLTQTLAGISMFVLARRFFSRRAATFAAACYAANPYALLVVYMRSDFAEELACAFLPLLVLSALQLCGLLENRWRSPWRVMAVFAALFAAIWLCNAPAGVMASYGMALLFAWAAFEEKSLRPLAWGAVGLALGLSLAAFYLLPVAYEQRWVNIEQALSPGLLPSENFLYTQTGDPEHNVFNWIASTVAVLLVAMTGIAGLVAYRYAKNKKEEGQEGKEKLWRLMLLLGATATILIMRISAVAWTYLPKLRFLQFPWRWMAILAVAFAYLGAAALTRRRAGLIWGAIVIMAVAGTGVLLVRKAWWDADDIPSLQDAIASEQGFDGTDEYDPVSDDHTNLPVKASQAQILPAKESGSSAPKAELRIEQWTAEKKDLTVSSPQPVRVAVRLLNYPAWRVEVNGKAVKPESAETTAQMILPLPAGAQHITIRFARTPDRTWGGGISAGAGIVALALLFLRPFKQASAIPDTPRFP